VVSGNILISTVGEQKFSLGSIVYINRQSPAPPAPPLGSSEATILEYDRANLWVAKVLEVRAKDNQHVYLRLFWLYWPDELQNKRQPYHGANEFIMSNDMDIVDAMTVAGPAEVTHWDEYQDEQEDLGQRFFRQFLDIKKLGKGSGLSPLRQHCICHKYYNPDKTMYKCPHEDCGMWNHEECLVDAILDKTYKRLVGESGPAANGTETTVLSTVKDAVTKTLFPAEKLKDLRKSQTPSSPIKAEVATPKSNSKAKKKLNGANRREGMFNAKITNGDEAVGKGVKVTITDERGQDPETWVEDVKCLKCGQVLD
jgi:BAH domain